MRLKSSRTMFDKPRMPLLEVERAEWVRTNRSKLSVRVYGSWNARRAPRTRTLLVIEVDGRRHRFPSVQPTTAAVTAGPASLCASFTIPGRLEPHMDSDMWLSVAGDPTRIPLPTLDASRRPLPAPAPTSDVDGARGPSRAGRPKVERREPRSERLESLADARMRRELDALARALRAERAARERHEATANALAKRVADIHAKSLEIRRQRDALKLECDHLAAQLETFRQDMVRGGSAGLGRELEDRHARAYGRTATGDLAA